MSALPALAPSASATIVTLPGASAPAAVPAAPPATTPFTHGPEFERKVAALALRDDRFAREATQFLKPDHFTDALDRNLVLIGQEFTKAYGATAEPVTLMGLVQANPRIPAVEHALYVARILELTRLDLRERDWVRENVVEFCQKQELLRLASQIPDLLIRPPGQKPEFDKVKAGLTKALSIGEAQSAQFVDYFGEAEARKDQRDAKARGVLKRGVSTGIPELDALLYQQGWGRGELSVPMAPAKRGKTAFALQSTIMSCLNTGANWLFISCEVGLDIVGDRLDACLTGTDMDKLVDERSRVATLVGGLAKGPGKFWLERYPSATLTTDGIDGLIQYYFDSGRKLDGVVVDYIGILKLKVPDDRYVGLGIATKELRRIAGKYDVAMIAPAQTNRDAVGKQTAGMDSIGESFAIVQDCDLLLSINANEQEMQHGVRRIAAAAGRNQGEFTIKVQGDMAKMRLVESVLEVQH